MHKQAISLREMSDPSGGLSIQFLSQMADGDEMMDLISSLNRLNVHEGALFSDALKHIYRMENKKARSERPKNRVEKMTLKDVYKNKRVNASFDNNLPAAVRQDLQQFVDNLRKEGFVMRRIPTIDIYPKDRQKLRKERIKKKMILN